MKLTILIISRRRQTVLEIDSDNESINLEDENDLVGDNCKQEAFYDAAEDFDKLIDGYITLGNSDNHTAENVVLEIKRLKFEKNKVS